jgi:hypothetical protein
MAGRRSINVSTTDGIIQNAQANQQSQQGAAPAAAAGNAPAAANPPPRRQQQRRRPSDEVRRFPELARGKHYDTALTFVAEARWHLTTAMEIDKADKLAAAGIEVFGQTAFEVACEEVVEAAAKEAAKAARDEARNR